MNEFNVLTKDSGRLAMLAVAVLSALIVLGCQTGEGTQRNGPADNMSSDSSADDSREDMNATVHAVQALAYDQRQEFVNQMKKELNQFESRLDELAIAAEDARDDAKAEAKATLEAVRQQWAQTKTKLEQAENATAEKWDEAKNSTVSAYGEMRQNFNKTTRWFKEKLKR